MWKIFSFIHVHVCRCGGGRWLARCLLFLLWIVRIFFAFYLLFHSDLMFKISFVYLWMLNFICIVYKICIIHFFSNPLSCNDDNLCCDVNLFLLANFHHPRLIQLGSYLSRRQIKMPNISWPKIGCVEI